MALLKYLPQCYYHDEHSIANLLKFIGQPGYFLKYLLLRLLLCFDTTSLSAVVDDVSHNKSLSVMMCRRTVHVQLVGKFSILQLIGSLDNSFQLNNLRAISAGCRLIDHARI